MILLQVDYYDFMTLIDVIDFHNTFSSTIAFLWLYWVNCPSFFINYFFLFFEPFTINF